MRTEDLVERGQDLGHGQLAVAGADEGRLDRVDLPGAAQAALLAEHDLARVLGTRRTERLLHDVDARRQPGGEELGVGQPAQLRRTTEVGGHLGTERLRDVVRPLLEAVHVPAAAGRTRRRWIQPNPTASAPCSSNQASQVS